MAAAVVMWCRDGVLIGAASPSSPTSSRWRTPRRGGGPYAYSVAEVGLRRLAALALGYLNARDTPEAAALAAAQHEAADNMTDEAAAFGCLLANRR